MQKYLCRRQDDLHCFVTLLIGTMVAVGSVGDGSREAHKGY
jgi:hypothetical protein